MQKIVLPQYEVSALNSKGEVIPKYKQILTATFSVSNDVHKYNEEQKPPLVKIAIFTMLATLVTTGTLIAIAWLISLVVN